MSKVKIIPDLRFPEFEKNGEWVETTIEQVAKVTTGNNHRLKIFVLVFNTSTEI